MDGFTEAEPMGESELTPLLEVLACPTCKGRNALAVRNAASSEAASWQEELGEERPIPKKLVCPSCGRCYPVTFDGIPVLWSDVLRHAFGTLETAIDGVNVNERDVKAANIHVYETIVEKYDSEGLHADHLTERRFLSALSRARIEAHGWHVDVGCGGGNMLKMTDGIGFGPRLGIDVSLSALRIVRGKGYHAVLGDAEDLPIRSSCLGLLTASSVLHHLFEPNRLIEEAHRVLRSGGLFFTDFDPSKDAADWGWLAKTLFNLRLPLYRLVSRWKPAMVGHASRTVQLWNKVAEFHNHPGAGFSPNQLTSDLQRAGQQVILVFQHNTRDNDVLETKLVRPNLRGMISQTLSFRNPFLRRNADSLLTLSRKPHGAG